MLNRCKLCYCIDCNSQVCQLHGDHSIYLVHVESSWKLAEIIGAMFNKNGVIKN